MHHHVGISYEDNAWVVIKWCWFWIVVFGLPCALAMFAPPWCKLPEDSQHHH